jgi:hypothetical protein
MVEYTNENNLISEDCFGRKFIVRKTPTSDHTWLVLTQDVEIPLGFNILLDDVDDCDTEAEAITAWQCRCEHNKNAESSDEDPHSPFYGLSDEQKDRLMAAIMKKDQLPSKIKGRSLPSRKDKQNEKPS